MATLVEPVETGRSARMVTVSLPGPLYDRIQRSAETQHRPLEEVLVEAAASALPPLIDLPHDVGDDVAGLPFMNDSALWQIARSTPPKELHSEMDALLASKGRHELSAAEQLRLDELVHAHEVAMLRRAQAAFLLQRRGYDMTDPAVLNRLP